MFETRILSSTKKKSILDLKGDFNFKELVIIISSIKIL